MPLTRDEAILIYQRAIDKSVDSGEGPDWWSDVQGELEAVIAAPSALAAAQVIAWWHHVWKDVNDTPTRAASRIRRQAAGVLTKKGKKRCHESSPLL